MTPTPLCLFSKHLQGAPIEQVADAVREAGITALDLTVRPGGHVDPRSAADDLPRFAEQLAKLGLSIGMITTDLTDAHDPLAEPLLSAAATLGVRHYKLGYYRYTGFGTLRALKADVTAKLHDVAALNAAVGICGGYHNHSDDFFGADLADVDDALAGIDPKHLGVYFDPAHATVEGGSRGWLMALDRVAPRIVMLAVKDFRWVDGKHRGGGARRFSVEWHPLAGGNTPWPEVIAALRTIGFAGPVSMHSEYQGKNSFRDLSTDEVIRQTAEDIEVFREFAGGAL